MPVSTHMFSAWQRLEKGIGSHVTGVADDCKVVLEIELWPSETALDTLNHGDISPTSILKYCMHVH